MIFRLLVCTIAAPLLAQSAELDAGIAHYNARRWTEAHAFFANATKTQPRNADAALWYGKTLIAEDKVNNAEDWFNKAASLDPKRGEIQLWLARAIGIQAQRANILRQPFLARRLKSTVDRAIELDPDNVDARELRWQFYAMAPGVMGGSDYKARAEAAEVMKRNRYRGQLIAINAASRAKDQPTVERTLKAMVAEFPDSLGPMGSYAGSLADQGRAAEAFGVVEAYQKRRPNDPMALYQIGRIAAVSGQQLDRGEDALRKFLILAPPPAPNVPSLSNAHMRLGNIAQKRGNTAAARAEYELALKLDPRNGQARRSLGTLK